MNELDRAKELLAECLPWLPSTYGTIGMMATNNLAARIQKAVKKEEKPMKGLTVGRMVHYVEEPLLGAVDESPVKAGEMKHRAAVVEEVLDEEDGLCLLLVMAPGNLREMKSRYLDYEAMEDAPSRSALMVGTWHWPERV